jgi:hypothetical protein
MRRALILCACLVLFPAVLAAAEDGNRVENPEAAVLAAAEDGNSAENPEGAVLAAAENVKSEAGSEAKELSGMSIVGNDEAPKSLYIVPWKSSEIGAETSLDTMLDEGDVPVDRDVFKRQLGFYHVSTGK